MTLPTALPEPILPTLHGGPTLRWGVLAPGSIAGKFTHALHAHTDQRVHAVGSRSLARAEAFASEHGIDESYASYQELVDDPGIDAVYIAPPHPQHKNLALLAIAAGKHVLIEKPIAVTADEAREIAAAAQEAGVFAMEAMHTRFHPRMTVIEQLLRDGVLGEVTSVAAELGIPSEPDPESRLHSPALAGGAILDVGVYAVWFNHFVLGKPDSVVARGLLTETGVDGQSVVTLTRGRALGSVTSSILGWTPSLASVNGTGGRIHVDTRHPRPGPFTLYGPDDQPHLRFEDTTGIEFHDGLCRQAAWMAQHVADGLLESPMHPLSVSIDVLETIDQVRLQLGTATVA